MGPVSAYFYLNDCGTTVGVVRVRIPAGGDAARADLTSVAARILAAELTTAAWDADLFNRTSRAGHV